MIPSTRDGESAGAGETGGRSARHLASVGLGANLPAHDPPTAASPPPVPAGAEASPQQRIVSQLRAAVAELARLPGTRLHAVSSIYRSAPVDADGPDFYNLVVQLDTALPAHALLDALQSIEYRFGRQRPYRNAPRTLDLDLLLYDDQQIDTSRLRVPHPRMGERAFVLRPLAELAPDLHIPSLGAIDALLAGTSHQVISRLGPLDVILGP